MGNETIDCPACDAAGCIVKENAKGALSVNCPACGYQAFARSPRSVAALKSKLGKARAPAGKPAAKPADDDGDFLKKL